MVFLSPGAIHIHTLHSDGTGGLKEVVRAAKKAGLEWIVITDHNKMVVQEGMYDGVCVIVGEEISPQDGDHYLAFDIKTPVSCDSSPQEYIDKVKEQGGFGFIAHPDESKTRKNSYKSLGWTDWETKGFEGLEIWNYMSNWADGYREKNPVNAVNSYLFRNNITGPTKKTLDWWDNLNNENSHIVPAIGGSDAHAFNIRRAFVTVKIFPYKSTFGKVTNFLNLDSPLSEDFESCKKAILNSIKTGRNIILNRGLKRGGKCACPVFYIQNRYEQVYSGASIGLDNCSKLVIELPRKAEIKVIHNGEIVLQSRVKQIELENLKIGKYRFEAYYKGTPWIFSNPIAIQ